MVQGMDTSTHLLDRPPVSSSLRPMPPPDVRRAGLRVRPTRPADELALVALLERCSPRTRHRRFHGAGETAMRRELFRIAHPTESHRSWVAIAGGDVVGTATLAIGRDGVPEAAFLVEDAWFRTGVGRRLLRSLAGHARELGLPEVIARAQADNAAVREFLRAAAPGARTRFAGAGEIEVVVPVTAVPTSGTAGSSVLGPPPSARRPVLVPPPPLATIKELAS